MNAEISRWRSAVAAVVAVSTGIAATVVAGRVETPVAAAASVTPVAPAGTTNAAHGLRFEPNRGQTDATARFVVRSADHSAYLTATDAVFVLAAPAAAPPSGPRPSTVRPTGAAVAAPEPKAVTGAVVYMHLRNANPDAQITADDVLPGVTNYLVGNDPSKWQTNVPGYGRVTYHGIYAGIDLVYRAGASGNLEYDFIVAPTASADDIDVEFQGADSVSAGTGGGLAVSTAAGEIRQGSPAVYQDTAGGRRTVPGGYVMKPDHRVGFSVGPHDPSRPVVIDPLVTYSTLVGGSTAFGNVANAIASDAAGDAYITGGGRAIVDFPTTPGAFQTSFPGQSRPPTGTAFVTKLSPDGSSLVYSTFLGGTPRCFCSDNGAGIAVDAAGHAFVTGFTESANFPTTPTAYQPTQPGQGFFDSSAFLTELNPQGSGLVYSTYLGGSGDVNGNGEMAGGVKVDPSGDVLIAGATHSPDFPVTPNAVQATCRSICIANGDGVSTLNSTTYTSATATFTADDAGQPISGTNIPSGTTIAGVNSTTSITLSAAATASGTGLTFNVTDSFREHVTAFFTSLDPTKSGSASLVYSTLLGGGLQSFGTGLAVDGSGSAYVVGGTDSVDFPTTAGSLQPVCGVRCPTYADGALDADLVTLHSPSAQFSQADVGQGIFGSGLSTGTHILAVVDATSVTLDTPGLSAGATSFTVPFRPSRNDSFVAKLDPALGTSALVYSTFLDTGGTSFGVQAIAVDSGGNAYLTGGTTSATFPTTAGAFDRACHGTTVSPCGVNPTFGDGVTTGGSTTFTSASAQFNKYTDLNQPITGANITAGTAIAKVVNATTVVLSLPATANGSGLTFSLTRDTSDDGFVTKLNPAGSAVVYSTYLGGAVLSVDNGIAVDGSGRAYVTGNTAATATYPLVDQVAAAGAGLPDAVVSELSPNGSSLVFSTLIGGAGADGGNGIAVDPGGVIHVAGGTSSADFPTTRGSFEPAIGGSGIEGIGDAFVVAIAPVPGTDPIVTGLSVQHGPLAGGLPVVLTGHGFTGATAVSFGGTPAPFTVTSDTRITATEPAQAAPPSGTSLVVPVTVTTAGGTSPANPVDTFTYGEGLWTATGQATQTREGASVTLLRSGKVLVAGGADTTRVNPAVASAELYDPAAGTWTPTASLNRARVGHTATLLPDGRVLVVGGEPLGSPQTGTAEIYDPSATGCGSNGCWTMVSSVPGGPSLFGHTATLLPSGRVLVAGGESNQQPTAAAQVFDPASNTWTVVGAMSTSRAAHTATLLPSGQVLVAGGQPQGSSLPTPTAELFDPAATGCGTGIVGCWTATGSMGQGRLGHTATLLPSGRVLVTGGGSNNGPAFTSIELYEPAGGTWTLVGVLQQKRIAHDAVLLPDGRVLVTGGVVGTFGANLATAELIDPADPSATTEADRMLAVRGQAVASQLAQLGAPGLGAVLLPTGQVLAFGGSGDATAELYSPVPRVTGITPPSGSSAGGTLVTVTGTSFTSGSTRVLFGGVQAPVVSVVSGTQLTAISPAGSVGPVDVTVATPAGASTPLAGDRFTYLAPPPGSGYWLVAADGGIFPFGAAGGYGSTGAVRLNRPIVGMAGTPTGHGYWLVAGDGGVFPFGDAVGYGSTGAVRLNQPVVGMAATPSGRGYWLVAADGGIFPFGDAVGRGSTGAIRLNRPIVGMAATPDGGGYWLVAGDGGIFPFGDAVGRGSTGAIRLNRPMVGMAATASGGGYWLVASDGCIFPFGDAVGDGSTGGARLNAAVVGMAASRDGGGYWLVAADGGIFPFGDAPGLGSTGGIRLNRPVVGMAASRG